MSLTLEVKLAVDQSDFQWAMVAHLDLDYSEIQSQMVELGFFKGNGDIVFDTRWPEDDLVNPVGKAIHEYMREKGYTSLRVYEDD